MFVPSTAQSFTTVAVAALVASLAVFLTSIPPEAEAASRVSDAFSQLHAKGERALVQGAACSPQGWPYYKQICQFDLRKPANEARTVRIIALR